MPIKKGTRKFNGKVYGLKTDYYTKSLAVKEAKRLRGKGEYLVRTIKTLTPPNRRQYSKFMYVLWIRRKK